MEKSGLYDKLLKIKPLAATEEQIRLFHTQEHIDNVKKLSTSGGGDCGMLAMVGNGSYEIAMLAVGAAIDAVKAVVTGECDNAYALTRPPGHHAEEGRGNGYCIFNNVAIAAKYAQKELGVKRILILDWDVHHGNGTEDAFYDNPDVLFVSIHQNNWYPVGRGLIEQTGTGAGVGSTINIPVPPGTGDGGYLYAIEQVIKPAADKFKPELIIISAGQDANFFDPAGRMLVTADGYRKMTEAMMKIADTHCGGKLVAAHEGGYSTGYVPFCSSFIVEEMSGITTDVADPFEGMVAGSGTRDLLEHQKKFLDAAKVHHGL
jgi:acetoin utilization deacetylase AcuC-like enzyme